MGTRRHWYALVLLVLWLSYYDHCAAPHSHCADSPGMCVSLMQPHEFGSEQQTPEPTPCTHRADHEPMLVLGVQPTALPAPATFALPEWLQTTTNHVALLDLDTLPVPPPENDSPPPLAMLTVAQPVRGPSL